MKTVLVPTDFSENAFIASQYAASLASARGFSVKLFHVYIVLYSGFEEKGISVQQIEWADEEAEKGMANLVATLQEQYPGITIEGKCERGFLVDALDTEVKTNPSLVGLVMGSKGATNMTENLFGSTTYAVLKRSKLPVLVIPGTTQDFKLDQIGFFTDFNVHEGEAIAKAKAFLGEEQKIHLIHLTDGPDGEIQSKLEKWRRACQDAGFPVPVDEIVEVEHAQVGWRSIVKVMADKSLDVLAFTRPEKPFFSNIFHKSLTKEMANYPIAPSLFING